MRARAECGRIGCVRDQPQPMRLRRSSRVGGQGNCVDEGVGDFSYLTRRGLLLGAPPFTPSAACLPAPHYSPAPRLRTNNTKISEKETPFHKKETPKKPLGIAKGKETKGERDTGDRRGERKGPEERHEVKGMRGAGRGAPNKGGRETREDGRRNFKTNEGKEDGRGVREGNQEGRKEERGGYELYHMRCAAQLV